MKLFALTVAFFALVNSAFSLKDAICGLKHSAEDSDDFGCRGAFEYWSYNANTNKCVEFIYGGCGGNANRFNSLKECEEKCKVSPM